MKKLYFLLGCVVVQLLAIGTTHAQNYVGSGGEFTNFSSVDLTTSTAWATDRSSSPGYFSAVGTATATGNSELENKYSYTDAPSSNTTYQYRLRMQDADGKEKLSTVQTAKLDFGNINYYVYTNQIGSQFTVQVPAGPVRTLQVFNAEGRQVIKTTLSANAARTISTAQWSKRSLIFNS